MIANQNYYVNKEILKMKTCENCENFEPWFQRDDGFCNEILRVLGFSKATRDELVYADVKKDFTCGAFVKSATLPKPIYVKGD